MKELTKRQRAILSWIKQFISEHGMPPTVREIGAAFEIGSSSVFDHLKALEKKGYLRRGDLGARSLIIEDQGSGDDATQHLPVIGRIAAGSPIEAVEDDFGSIPVNKNLLRGSGGFALRVEGDSMVEAGIHDGDYVIMREQETAENSDIVVAIIDGEATLKRFYKEKDGVRLEPANGQMEAIKVDSGDFRIQGKVIGVMRLMDGAFQPPED
jgi:repressor LexA